MGFRTRELMSGEHEFRAGHGPAGRHPFAFRVKWGPDRLGEWLNPLGDRFLWNELEGEILVGGLCDWTPCRGTLDLEYFGPRRIRYTFDLEVAGKTYRYVGDKVDIRAWNLPVSHTTCFGTLVELATGTLVSTSVTRFKMRHLPSMLLSTRWA